MCTNIITVVLVFIIYGSVYVHAGSVPSTGGEALKIFCYFTNWSNKMQNGDARFAIQDINGTLCTHLIYAFANIDSQALKLIKGQDDDDNGQLYADRKGRYFDFNNLKIKSPHLVTFLSVGGAEGKSNGFIQIVQSNENMKLFSENCVTYLRDRDFDGLDIDWEWPTDIFREKFTKLLQLMKEEFKDEALRTGKPRLLIAIAVAVGDETITNSYNITEISNQVDFINVMAYDFHGRWSKVTSFSSPLYSRASTHLFDQRLSQAWAIERWLSSGAPADKLVMGLTASATYFRLADPSNYGVGAAVNGSFKGPYLQQLGRATYYRVCELVRIGAVERWDDEQKMAYSVKEDQWLGYGNHRSMREKVQYAYSKKLAGTMFWSLDLDDFTGRFCKQGRYPLLTAIYDTVQQGAPVPSASGNHSRDTTISSTTPIDFRLHHNTNKNGINIFHMNSATHAYTSPFMLTLMMPILLNLIGI